MNTNSYLTAASATQVIDSRIREAQLLRLAAEARRTTRTPRPRLFTKARRPSWARRPAPVCLQAEG
jgi:hypothetical protein